VLGALSAGLVIAWILVLLAETDGTKSTANQNAFGHLTAALVLVLFTGLVAMISGRLGGFVIGKDKRVSTSRLQVVIWTYAIVFALLSLIAATWVGPDTGFDKLTDPSFDFADYLVLLGGPFAAAVLARGIVGSQVARGEVVKPPGEPTAAQAFTNDEGDADIVDSQYLLFNLVALIYFLGAFFQAPADGLPDIPTVLFVLTGASAAGYVSNKAVATSTPVVTSIYPTTVTAAAPFQIEIFGQYLLFPAAVDPAATPGSVPIDPASPQAFQPVRVMVAGAEATLVAGTLAHSGAGDDRLTAQVAALAAGEYDVTVLNFRGVVSGAKRLVVR
jgi:hypothetical protein